MSREIDIEVYRAFREAGTDPDYLMGMDYEVANWEKEGALKGSFPVNAEAQIFTNGRHAVKIDQDIHNTTNASLSFENVMDAVMKLKAADPDLPVYGVHNHPSAENIWGASGRPISDIPEDWKRLQTHLASVPSKADTETWDAMHNVAGAAIYHQDTDEIRIWKEGDERNRIGTKLAIEYELRKFDATGFKLEVPEKQPINVRWADEAENEPNTEYIQPNEWTEKKGQWIDMLSWQHISAPWAR